MRALLHAMQACIKCTQLLAHASAVKYRDATGSPRLCLLANSPTEKLDLRLLSSRLFCARVVVGRRVAGEGGEGGKRCIALKHGPPELWGAGCSYPGAEEQLLHPAAAQPGGRQRLRRMQPKKKGSVLRLSTRAARSTHQVADRERAVGGPPKLLARRAHLAMLVKGKDVPALPTVPVARYPYAHACRVLVGCCSLLHAHMSGCWGCCEHCWRQQSAHAEAVRADWQPKNPTP